MNIPPLQEANPSECPVYASKILKQILETKQAFKSKRCIVCNTEIEKKVCEICDYNYYSNVRIENFIHKKTALARKYWTKYVLEYYPESRDCKWRISKWEQFKEEEGLYE